MQRSALSAVHVEVALVLLSSTPSKAADIQPASNAVFQSYFLSQEKI